ncbi:hypothetical protein Tel_15915 [Candidatus Tenderia electrophaga]|jgi:hypothetical protein|uniref:Methanethiol oxidase n=1 Tax=Candidatus Tenderia electrophaga TaxID=1748243 RepID=A0A0S2TH93_9GAMM|nr:hypothetical protein Tel_15915 [Candidatus Tenderia electrophaga]
MKRFGIWVLAALFGGQLVGISQNALAQANDREESQGIVLLRSLPTLSDHHSVAIIELDPEAETFGDIIHEHEIEIEGMKEPLHHLYYSPQGRLYATGLDAACSLAEIGLHRGATGSPKITGVDCIDTKGMTVGEDIMWHMSKGTEYMFVTFMGGTGGDDGGALGVFDAQTNEVVKIIEARKSQVGDGKPYIMYPHGISAYQDRMVISSTIHPDLATGVGNTITIIDLNTLEPIQTITVEDAKPVGFPSSPVEVLFVRPSIHPEAEPAVLVNTMFGFETWKIPYDADSKEFGTPVVVYSGVENNTGVPLEFYGNKTDLFISHALPGVVKRYDLSKLPDLVPSGPDIVADPGAHHLIFYTSKSGRNLIAVQNNLLNLGNAADKDPTDIDFIASVNAHTISVHDLETGKRLATVNFKQRYKKGVEYVDALFGSGFVHHH